MGKVTFVVDFKDGQEPTITFGDKILGAKIVAVAFYDSIHTASIAEDALAECGCRKCRDASKEINQLIIDTMVKRLPERSVSDVRQDD